MSPAHHGTPCKRGDLPSKVFCHNCEMKVTVTYEQGGRAFCHMCNGVLANFNLPGGRCGGEE